MNKKKARKYDTDYQRAKDKDQGVFRELHENLLETEEKNVVEKRLKIAFDVDDTLIIPSIVTGEDHDIPNKKVIAIFRWFQDQGHEMTVWSGGGVDYAKRWAEKLDLSPCTIRIKQKSEGIDIAFDDCDVDLAKVNVKVKRIKNNISRAGWNKH